jgi:hypothetical protein
MALLNDEQKKYAMLGCGGFVCLWIVIILITIFASIRAMGPTDQIVVHGPQGKYTINGPRDTIVHPFRKKEERKATRVTERQYVVVKNARSGLVRHEEGPQLLFLGAWDELVEVKPKITLQQRGYMRLVDELTGYERIVKGPRIFVPMPLESSPNGTEAGITISAGKSVLTLNKTLGVRQLHITDGMFIPGPYEEVIEVRPPIVIAPMEYCIMKDLRTGDMRVASGPMQLKLGAYEQLVGTKREKIMLQKDEFVRLVDGMTGIERIVRGPDTIVPNPLEASKTTEVKQKAVHVSALRAVLTINAKTGVQRLVTTEGVFVPEPYESILEIRDAMVITLYEYVVIRNTRTGLKRVEQGAQTLFLREYEELVEQKKQKIALQKGYYIRMVDKKTGVERVMQGPQTFMPTPEEYAPDGAKEAIFVDTETALLVRDRALGTKILITTIGAFIPAPYQTIIETRRLIKVLPHQSIVVRDHNGRLNVKQGGTTAAQAAFFLGPYEQVVTQKWSSFTEANADGSALTKADVTAIDMRVKPIFFKYEVRTSDNVVLQLEGTIFWKVSNVANMLATTGDPEGDIWYHCRSALIQAISKTTYEKFMDDFNTISMNAFTAQKGDAFYTTRGVDVQNMELTRQECVDPAVDAIRQLIIQETTNRINRLQEANSKVDVELEAMTGKVALEQQRYQLLVAKGVNHILEARMIGEAFGKQELETVKTFISELNSSVTDVSERVAIFKLQEQLRGRTQDIKNLQNSSTMNLMMAPKEMTFRMDMSGKGGAVDPIAGR